MNAPMNWREKALLKQRLQNRVHTLRSELAEHVVRAGNLKARTFFDIELGDLAVVHNHGITLRTFAHAEA